MCERERELAVVCENDLPWKHDDGFCHVVICGDNVPSNRFPPFDSLIMKTLIFELSSLFWSSCDCFGESKSAFWFSGDFRTHQVYSQKQQNFIIIRSCNFYDSMFMKICFSSKSFPTIQIFLPDYLLRREMFHRQEAGGPRRLWQLPGSGLYEQAWTCEQTVFY